MTTRPRPRWLRPLLFALVGGLAFGVDMGVLALLVRGQGVSATTARVVSILVASSLAWCGNRYLTFSASRRTTRWREWLAYLGANGAGMALNYGVYLLIVSLSRLGAAHPLLSVVPGGLAGLALNYGLVSRRVFHATSRPVCHKDVRQTSSFRHIAPRH